MQQNRETKQLMDSLRLQVECDYFYKLTEK